MPKNYWDFAPPCFRKKVRMFKHQFNFLLLWDIQQCVEGQVLIFSIQIGELCWLLSFVSQFQKLGMEHIKILRWDKEGAKKGCPKKLAWTQWNLKLGDGLRTSEAGANLKPPKDITQIDRYTDKWVVYISGSQTTQECQSNRLLLYFSLPYQGLEGKIHPYCSDINFFP